MNYDGVRVAQTYSAKIMAEAVADARDFLELQDGFMSFNILRAEAEKSRLIPGPSCELNINTFDYVSDYENEDSYNNQAQVYFKVELFAEDTCYNKVAFIEIFSSSEELVGEYELSVQQIDNAYLNEISITSDFLNSQDAYTAVLVFYDEVAESTMDTARTNWEWTPLCFVNIPTFEL